MKSAAAPVKILESAEQEALAGEPGASAIRAPVSRELPSGRSVVLKLAGSHEEVEIRSPTGEVEVVISLTENGPVVRLRGARLELDTPDELSLSCRRLAIHSQEETALSSDGSVRIAAKDMFVKTTDVTDFKGAPICFNVKDEVRAAKWPPRPE